MKRLIKPSVIPAILWAFILAILLLLPPNTIPQSKLLSYDKLAHIGVFFILAFLIGWGQLSRQNSHYLTRRQVLVVFILATTYGTLLEFLQQFIPGRMTDFYDFLANSLGGLFGVIVFYIFTRKKFAKLKLML